MKPTVVVMVVGPCGRHNGGDGGGALWTVQLGRTCWNGMIGDALYFWYSLYRVVVVVVFVGDVGDGCFLIGSGCFLVGSGRFLVDTGRFLVGSGSF